MKLGSAIAGATFVACAWIAVGASEESQTGKDTVPVGSDVRGEPYPAPVESLPGLEAYLFAIPAPRGLICDRNGEPLAYSRTGRRCAVRLPDLAGGEKGSDLEERVRQLAGRLKEEVPSVEVPDEDRVARHWKHRPWVPFPLSPELEEEEVEVLAPRIEDTPALVMEPVYTRAYTRELCSSHFVGYVGREKPDQHGPPGNGEELWPRFEGRSGLERALDEALRGEDGMISFLCEQNGEVKRRQMALPPRPGHTVITTISLPMQRLAARILQESGRSGAFVVMDAETGDLLALVSNPSFDANEFVPSIAPELYREWSARKDAPFYDRAVAGAYPPGSTFKPLVALAAMEAGVVHGTYTQFAGPPALEINGKVFRNWNGSHEGILNVHHAILRSCNTWFYQVGLNVGSQRVLQTAKEFGLGRAPRLPLQTVGAGNLPKAHLDGRAVANLSIGQGELLVSPLQMTVAMAGLSRGRQIPEPRLVLEVQDSITGRVKSGGQPRRTRPLRYQGSDLADVLAGMWGVVNHPRGTGRAAAVSRPKVYGKTGTAQWAVDGKKRQLAWFTGFVGAEDPALAFAVLCEGRPGESVSGGGVAAPLAGTFLRTVYGSPGDYGVTRPAHPRPDPMIVASTPPEPERRLRSASGFPLGIFGAFRHRLEERTYESRPRRSERRGLFGRRRRR